MLWLAGLMGLMAVGAVTFVEPQPEEDEETVAAPDGLVEGDLLQADALEVSDLDPVPEDNFEPDYDPRGGDDAAILDPAITAEEDLVTLTDGTENDDNFDGDDTLPGGAGNDALRGDPGDDTLDGDTGNDTLDGHAGNDVMHGDDQDDTLFGHNDDDALFGNAGNDLLQGSAGDDALDGGDGDDTLQGGLDDDTLIGGNGADALFGGWGNDILSGLMRDAAGNDQDTGDFLNGGGGDDSILAGSGDFITAGAGADEIVLGDWLASGEAAHIMDYAAADDSLVLVWDDSAAQSAEPQITLTVDPDADDQTLVLMNGAIIATVNGNDLLASDIALIPLSTATHVGLAAT